MKTKLAKSRRNLLIGTAICLLLMLFSVLEGYFIDEIIVQRCYYDMNSTTAQISQDTFNTFNNAEGQLQLIANIAAKKDFNSQDEVQQYLDSLSTNSTISTYAILLPDNTMLFKKDAVRMVDPLPEYDQVIQKRSYITSTRTGENGLHYIAMAKPFDITPNTQGVLFGFINLEEMTNFFHKRNATEKFNTYLINGNTGEFLINTSDNPMQNIIGTHAKTCHLISGRSFQEATSDWKTGRSGHSVFDCVDYDSPLYSYYHPVGMYGLTVQITETEDSLLAGAAKIRRIIYIFCLLQALLCCLVIFYLIRHDRRRRLSYQHTIMRNKFAYDIQHLLFSTANNRFSISTVLQEVKEFVDADTVLFATMENADRKEIFCYPMPNKVQLEEIGKSYFINLCEMVKDKRSLFIGEYATAQFIAEGKFPALEHIDVRNIFVVPEYNIRKELIGLLMVINLPNIKEHRELLENIADNLQMAIQNLEAYQLLQKIGMTDELTGLRNRNAYEQAINRYEADPDPYCCIYGDANGLHDLNNTLGHEAGDAMLTTVARSLKSTFGEEYTYRIGGDEFVAFTKTMNPAEVEMAINHLREVFTAHNYHVSFGWAFQAENQFLRYTISLAEKAMYQDKEAYYKSAKQSGNARRNNQKLEDMLMEKRDQDSFLRAIASSFMGVYIVNLTTDDTRVIFRPNYFDEILKECHYRFRNSFRQYVEKFVQEECFNNLRVCFDFRAIEQMLDSDVKLELLYTKHDNTVVRIKIVKAVDYDGKIKNTLWIFEAMN